MACPRTKPYSAGGSGAGQQLCCPWLYDETATGGARHHSVRDTLADANDDGCPGKHGGADAISLAAGYRKRGDSNGIGPARGLHKRVPGSAVAAVRNVGIHTTDAGDPAPHVNTLRVDTLAIRTDPNAATCRQRNTGDGFYRACPPDA